MRLRLRKSFYRISIVYPLTGLCLHSFEIKRHSQSACTHVQAARHAFREIWQSIIESVAKLCPDFRILIRGWTIFERIVHRAFIVSFVYDKYFVRIAFSGPLMYTTVYDFKAWYASISIRKNRDYVSIDSIFLPLMFRETISNIFYSPIPTHRVHKKKRNFFQFRAVIS